MALRASSTRSGGTEENTGEKPTKEPRRVTAATRAAAIMVLEAVRDGVDAAFAMEAFTVMLRGTFLEEAAGAMVGEHAETIAARLADVVLAMTAADAAEKRGGAA